MHLQRTVSVTLGIFALILLIGVFSRTEHLFGDDQLLVLGAAFMLIHAAFNPDMILAPLKYADQNPTRYGFTRTFGILFIILGVVELTTTGSALTPVYH